MDTLRHAVIVCCLSQATHLPFRRARCKFPSAETALKETKSSALLEEILEKEGFTVTRGVGGMPTAFVASAGSGAPVVAILAEYDALPGLSQKAGEAKKSPVVAGELDVHGRDRKRSRSSSTRCRSCASTSSRRRASTGLHRMIKDGGLAANIIPDYARVQWFVRDEKLVQRNLERVGAPRFDAAAVALAKAIQKEVGIPETGLSDAVLPWAPGRGSGASSDVGEVSAAVPLAELAVQTGPTGAPWHHWDVASCAANSIGIKGMLVAAKVLASSMTDPLRDPAAVAAAKAEFQKATGSKPYVSPLAKDAVPKTY